MFLPVLPCGCLVSIFSSAIFFPFQESIQEDCTMRFVTALTLALFAMASVPTVNFSQGGQMETSRGVAGGGISVPGWTGKIDAKEETAGMTLNSAKLVKEGDALHVTTGPAVTYWNPE